MIDLSNDEVPGIHELLCKKCSKLIANLSYLLVRGETYHTECWNHLASEEKHAVETVLR